MNGAGTGLQLSMMKIKKVATTQPVLRRGLSASSAVVVGSAVRTAAPFLPVITTPRTTASATRVSVLCVPVLNKIKKSPTG